MSFVKWFNNSKLMQFIWTPLKFKRFWEIAQRSRFCEKCLKFSYDVHWCKDDKEIFIVVCSGCKPIKEMRYGHTYKCSHCFYGIK